MVIGKTFFSLNFRISSFASIGAIVLIRLHEYIHPEKVRTFRRKIIKEFINFFIAGSKAGILYSNPLSILYGPGALAYSG